MVHTSCAWRSAHGAAHVMLIRNYARAGRLAHRRSFEIERGITYLLQYEVRVAIFSGYGVLQVLQYIYMYHEISYTSVVMIFPAYCADGYEYE